MLYARAKEGKRAYAGRAQAGKNVSLISAIRLEGVVAQTEIYGAFDGISFEAFIHNHLGSLLQEGDCLIVDNCSIHKVEKVEKYLKEKKVKLIFLSPYSPDFNPIENLRSKVKAFLKKIGARSYVELLEGIKLAFEQVSLEDIRSWFTHCCYCYS